VRNFATIVDASQSRSTRCDFATEQHIGNLKLRAAPRSDGHQLLKK